MRLWSDVDQPAHCAGGQSCRCAEVILSRPHESRRITTKKLGPVRASTTTRTYVYCRVAARDALAHAKALSSGSFYFYMMAATFAAFTVEAFLNDLGERKVHAWASVERGLGPKEKLTFLTQSLHLQVDHSRRPFQTLRDMVRVRHALAHGRTLESTSEKAVVNLATDWPDPAWKKPCRPTSVARMVEDAELIVRDLNARVGSRRDPFASLGGGWSA